MGNWTTVMIEGKCDVSEVTTLKANITMSFMGDDWHCLTNGGICGLPMWAGAQISAVGNLAERGYDAQSVKETLEWLAKESPSLAVKVHVGGDHEDKKCVATVTLHGGEATVGDPEIEDIPEITEDQMKRQMTAQMTRQNQF